MDRLTTFLAELRRRRVYQVAVVYAAAAFATAQAADLFLPRLGLPDRAVTLVMIVVVAGFPVALILGWTFDLTLSGVQRTGPAAGPALPVPVSFPRWRAVVGVTAAALALALGSWWLTRVAFRPTAPTIGRLAVLPFANLTSDPEQEHFIEGLHDALISELQQAGVPAIARTSVMRYRRLDTPVRDIARELGVGAVVESSVLRVGDSIRFRARLVDGRTEEPLWTQAYAVDVRQIPALHHRVTREVAREIRVTLTPRARSRLAAAGPVNARAYEAYLKGRVHAQRLAAAELDAAQRYFEMALEHDPTYAPAHVGIAHVWRSRRQMGLTPSMEATRRARAALAAAIRLDSTLVEIHESQAEDVWYSWDWSAGERRFRRALELNPSDAQARAFYSHLLMILGRPAEAMAEIELARRLDPLNPLIHALYGVDLLLARRYDEAVAELRRVIERVPNHGVAHTGLGAVLHLLGRHEDTMDAMKTQYRASGDRELEQALERGNVEGGYRAAMLRVAEVLAARSRATSTGQVRVSGFYLRAGERARALEWLEHAYRVRDPNLAYVGVLPLYDELRGDPRFEELLRRMNYPR